MPPPESTDVAGPPGKAAPRGQRRIRAAGPFQANPGFRLLWISNLFFFGGIWTQTLILGWMVFDSTRSEFLLAVFTALRLAPLLLGPLAGALSDRFDRKLVLVVASTWAFLAVAAVAVLAFLGLAHFWVLAAGGFVIGLAQSPSQPARSSYVLDLVGHRQLGNANALNAVATNVTQMIGPAVGGASIALFGAPAALAASALWYVVSLLALLPLKRTRSGITAGHGSVWRMLADGSRAVCGNRLSLAVLLITLSANVFVWPIHQSFMPVFADENLGLDAAGLGALLGSCGAGSVLGSLVIALLGDFRRKGAAFLIGTGIMALVDGFLELERSSGKLEWSAILQKMASDLGFSKILFGLLPKDSQDYENAFIVGNYPAAWREHYDRAGYARVDPTVSHCTQSVLPIFWEPSIYQTRKQHEFFEEASAAGLVYGLTMPLHGARGELGALSLSVEAENRAEANRFIESVLPTLWMLKDYALQSGAGLAFEHPVSKPVVLTSREKEVLQWCAIGKTSWEISVICNCSEANVNFHMGNIRRKFGVTSRRVAAIMAVNLGLITL